MMKLKYLFGVLAVVAGVMVFLSFQKKDTWSQNQLMQPAELAAKLNEGKGATTMIFNIGPSGKIKNSILIGATQDRENLDVMNKKLAGVSKNTEVVVYCGCCPFQNCPNIRPAMAMLNDMKFTNAKLLNLSTNLKVDWIDKGYPMQKN